MSKESSTHLHAHYQPGQIEEKIYQRWEKNNAFVAHQSDSSYCIMIPPPNVTGSLHMGHAFQDTIMDTLIRYQTMQGKQTLWQSGTDHAGIATQMVVERQLAAQGSNRHDLGREKFIERIWQWKTESGGTITNQLRRMGAAIDWSRERFTMDDGLSAAVNKVFIDLYHEGLIYRGKRLVNWDPVLQTAVSDLEVESIEEKGHIWHLRYPLVGCENDYLVVATTRPETMLGDTAVAIHPQDQRFSHLPGKSVQLPLVDRQIPIIADDYVDPEFGSGCVKITPAHDFNDYEVGKRHDLPMINILDKNAAISLPDSKYHGLDRYQARKQIISDLKNQGLLESTENHNLMVPRGDRSGAVLEPLLTDQWFVKVEPLAKQAVRAVEDGEIRFIPDNWRNTYFDWMHNIQDWCISRQIWWGHRIPAWYDANGKIYVANNLTEAQAQAGVGVDLVQDDDVLDTWFSSALWPFSTLGWPAKTDELASYYPTSVLVTGFDIIFFWVARMVMFGLKFTGKVPFHEVYIHGLVRDQDGHKMSKSKGNVLDPLDLIDGIELEALVKKRTQGLMQPKMAASIEKATRKQFPDGITAYGTDALRFTFASQATLGRDIRFDLARVEGYRNFCNKLWNASRFVIMNTPDSFDYQPADALSLADSWILSRLQQLVKSVHETIAEYRFDQLAKSLYQFICDDYCSWYLELAKVVLNDPQSSTGQITATQHTLIFVLEHILRLAHPVMPYITEELWQQLKPFTLAKQDTVLHCDYPEYNAKAIDEAAIAEMNWLQSLIGGVRTIRGEMNINPGKTLPILLKNVAPNTQQRLDKHAAYLSKFGKFASVTIVDNDGHNDCAMALVGNMQVLVPMGAFIDPKAERQRLQKELDKNEKELTSLNNRLNNPDFIDKAPQAVINKAKEQLTAAQVARTALLNQLEKV